MQLKQLKLAGFKSFVDPTTIPFPSQLVGVVGPNGCGKSNVIDAVRWVMGESSAKNLRGESMIDVIFNGSSQRKAVGQASVELVFDNSLGRLTGQYGSYQEISVKRLVTRDGDSSYFLNGTRCRRRDITDIFLGTGAGTRGYSIIGQGTISRIVEARPEELRAFLEEAAGISKYKERRRETLQRINQTRENLARVADIREELDKQLQRLERQAKAAERYQQLKEEERRCKAEILVLKWMAINEDQTQSNLQLNQLILASDQQQTSITSAFNQTTQLREDIHDANNAYQTVQNSYYQLSTDIVRLEEIILQQQREHERLLKEQQLLQQEWQILTSQVQEDQNSLCQSDESLLSLRSDAKQLEQELQQLQQNMAQLQSQKLNWQTQWSALDVSLTRARREKDVEQARLQQLARRRQEKQLLLQKIIDEQQQINADDLDEQLAQQQEALAPTQLQLQQQEEIQQQLVISQNTCRQLISDLESQLSQQQGRLHQLSVERATLAAQLKASAPHGVQNPMFNDTPRLFELMQVEEQWQQACELVLGNSLQAVVVGSMADILQQMTSLPRYSGDFICAREARQYTDFPRLSSKIKGMLPSFQVPLETIIAAETLEEACSWLPDIKDDESIITANGYWLSRNWLRAAALSESENEPLLAKQQRLLKITDDLHQSKTLIDSLQDHLNTQKTNQQQVVLQLETIRQTINEFKQELKENELTLSNLQRLKQQQQTNKLRLQDAYDDCAQQLEESIQEQLLAEQALQAASVSLQQDEQAQQLLQESKIQWEEPLQKGQQDLEALRTSLHQNELMRERHQLTINQLKTTLIRDGQRLQLLQDSLEELAERLLSPTTTDENSQQNLLLKVEQQAELALLMQESREKLEALQQQLENDETAMRQGEKQVKMIQEQIQQQQLNLQALSLRADALLENLQELNFALHDLQTEMTTEITLTKAEQQLLSIVEKIKRLGAINLAAIEEYDNEAQRKKHLDEQYNDLMEALAILDTAIEKMDKETRQRLQVTFDEVNKAFQTLFPRLFGGGRAMLELTCDNLLEAGVLVMAQPPGKRNSTIHLLSGGEKAMTAVALVFAIFQLNPSPFCMLDEVDAPLDDLNVGRFCALVKEMSHAVQFLFITHNKVTMELAEHLIGVTMREPGVSRVVAVDVEQALALVEA